MKRYCPFLPLSVYETSGRNIPFSRLLLLISVCFTCASVIAQPVITGVSPQKGNPGALVTITGTGFNTTPVNNKVYFGATKASVVGSTATSLSVNVPFGATYDNVSVNNTVMALTGYSLMPFLPTFNNSAFIAGSINFEPAFPIAMPNINAVAIGDVDGDGKPDLVVSDNIHTVSVYRNTSTSGSITAGSFASKVDFTTGNNPYTILLKDVDGDSKLDIITANEASASVSVLRNTITTPGAITTASFAPKVSFLVGGNPHALGISDINGDGKPDLIVTNYGSSSISVLQNISTSGTITTGSFAPRVDFATLPGPLSLAIADIDGDGKQDVVVSGMGVSILRNTYVPGLITTSSFAPKYDLPVYGFSCYVAAPDLDADNKPDIVVGIYNSTGVVFNMFKNVSVPGTINGTSMASPVSVSTADHMRISDMAIADADGDGKPDIISTITDDESTDAIYTTVIRNIATAGSITSASFATPLYFDLEIYSGSLPRLCVGDIDGDARPDLVVTNNADGLINIERNSPQVSSIVPPPVISNVSPDAGMPGNSVTITGSNFNTTAASNNVYFGASKGTVTSASATSLSVTVPTGATYQPVSVSNAATNLTAQSRSPFLPTFGDCGSLVPILNFDNLVEVSGATAAYESAVGDFNGDGKADFVYPANEGSGTSLGVIENTSSSGAIGSAYPTGAFFPAMTIPGGLKVADADGDGKLDIIYVEDADYSSYGYQAITILHNKSTGGPITNASFDNKVEFYTDPVDDVTELALGDLDGDGKPEIVTGHDNGFFVFHNNTLPGSMTAGSFSHPADFVISGSSYEHACIADMDGDGKNDVILGDVSNHTFSIFRNTTSVPGPASFAPPVTFTLPPGQASLIIADVNRDGKPDIVSVNNASDNISIFQNVATAGNITTGSLASRVDIATPSGPLAAFVCDMDGGGSADLVVTNTDGVSVFFNTAAMGSTIAASSFAAPVNYTTGRIVNVADIDGDKQPDLIGIPGAAVSVIRNHHMCGEPITGTPTLCISGGTTTLSDVNTGGTWTSSNPTVASVGSSTGIVTGGTAGTAIISYAYPTGAYNPVTVSPFTATIVVTVMALPSAGTVSGPAAVCVSAGITLSATATGGTWSSAATGTATVNSAGLVAGVSAGTATISYTSTNGCGAVAATQVVTVIPLPNAGTISGTPTVCISATTTLTSTGTSGTWSSSAAGTATVGSSTGVVTGVTTGTTVITYNAANVCGAAFTTRVVTVNAVPSAGTVTGTTTVCASATTTFSDAITGGAWSSGATSVATVNTAGTVLGVGAGTSTISYSVSNACGTAVATRVVTVNPLPNAGTIIGPPALCPVTTVALTDASAGGAWASSNPASGTISSTGIVTGILPGTTNISYTVINGCGTAVAAYMVTVNPMPDAGIIAGPPVMCEGATTTLTDAMPGGIWSSSMPVIGSISTSGVVSGLIAGTVNISYSVTNSCGTAVATQEVTINPLPDAGSITGTASVCVGSTTTLSDGSAGGSWTSSNLAIGSVGSSSGIVTGLAAGTMLASYTVVNGCGIATIAIVVTVNPLPHAGPITGTPVLCVGGTTTLGDAVAGGAWESGSTATGTINTAGMVTGIAAGTVIISYSVTNVCGTDVATKVVTVTPLPDAGTITGNDTVCVSDTVQLLSTATGGTWSSSNTSTAIVNTAGIVAGVSAGTANITYSVTNLCGTAESVYTVHVLSLAECAAAVNPVAVKNTGILIFPNPTMGDFTVQSAGGVLAIYTLEGKELAKYRVQAGSQLLSLPHGIAAGVYMCRFTSEAGSTAAVRLIYKP